jgi:hypothetical protein
MFQQSVKFGDCIISKDGNGIRITPIRLAKKLYPSIKIDTLQVIPYTKGIIQKLADGLLSFDQFMENNN